MYRVGPRARRFAMLPFAEPGPPCRGFRCNFPYGFRRTIVSYYHARRADRCKTEMTWQLP